MNSLQELFLAQQIPPSSDDGLKAVLLTSLVGTLFFVIRKGVVVYLESRKASQEYQQGIALQREQREHEIEMLERNERKAMIEAMLAISKGMSQSQQVFLQRSESEEASRKAMVEGQNSILVALNNEGRRSELATELLRSINDALQKARAVDEEGNEVVRDQFSQVIRSVEGLTVAITTSMDRLQSDVASIKVKIGLEE